MAKRTQMPKTTQRRGSTAGRPAVKSKSLLLWIIIGAAVLVVAGIALLQLPSVRDRTPAAASRVGEGSAWGPADAEVVIVDYSDFGCIHCRNFALNEGRQLREEYEAGGRVRFEFKHFIIGGEVTRAAANAAECAADQGRFWDYHDVLFSQQGVAANPFSEAALKQYGAQLGLDAGLFNQCVEDGQHINDVIANHQAGQGQGVQATPTFFINSEKLEGAYPYEEFKTRIDALLAES